MSSSIINAIKLSLGLYKDRIDFISLNDYLLYYFIENL